MRRSLIPEAQIPLSLRRHLLGKVVHRVHKHGGPEADCSVVVGPMPLGEWLACQQEVSWQGSQHSWTALVFSDGSSWVRKHGDEYHLPVPELSRDVLAALLALLPARELGVLSCVCREWAASVDEAVDIRARASDLMLAPWRGAVKVQALAAKEQRMYPYASPRRRSWRRSVGERRSQWSSPSLVEIVP